MNNTIYDSADTMSGMVDEFVARGTDLRTALFFAIHMIKFLSEDRFPVYMDCLELRASMHGDYEDVKIWLHEMAKKKQSQNPFDRMMGDLFGTPGDPPDHE